MPNYLWQNTYDKTSYEEIPNNDLPNYELPKLNQPLAIFIYSYDNISTTTLDPPLESTQHQSLRAFHIRSVRFSYTPTFGLINTTRQTTRQTIHAHDNQTQYW